eukprot:3540680-Pleurochrysis_carterae.AAC.1
MQRAARSKRPVSARAALKAARVSKEHVRCAPSAKHATCSAVKAPSVGASVRSKRPESRKS